MGYLKTETVTVDGARFDISELCHRDYIYAKEAGDNEETFALRVVERGVKGLDGDAGEILPPRMVGALAQHILRLSIPEDAEGNSESTPAGGLSSV